MTAADLSALCQRCGLCCSGALFTFLPLEPAEVEATRALGVRLEERRDGRTALLLPCAMLQGSCCSAYDRRPGRCQAYVCELGKALQRHERTHDAAQAIVDEAKDRLARLEAQLPARAECDPRSTLQRAQQLEATAPDDARFRAVRAEARAIEAMLRQYIVGPY